MKHILIPTDFSENAEHAVKYAISLVGDLAADLHIVHILEPFVPASELAVVSTNLFKEQFKVAEERLADFRKRIEKSVDIKDNIDLTCSVKIGSVVSVVNEAVEDSSIEFVVMGTRGENHGALDRFLGTVSSVVLEQAPCPVLLVPKDYQWKLMDNIIFATDLKDEDKATIRKAVEIIEPNEVIVQCVYVADEEEPTFNPRAEKMAKELKEGNTAIQTVFQVEINDSVEQALKDYADNYDAELIVMKRTKHNIFYRLLNGSHTSRMIHQSYVPLLVINS